MKILSLPVLSLSLIMSACASVGTPAPAATETLVKPLMQPELLAGINGASTDFEKDRRSILAMLGEYEVGFSFEETVVLKPGYARTPPKRSGAFETVVLVEDSGKRIVLQHLLVSKEGGLVTKHWRQDWTFEAASRLEFSEDQTWRLKPIAAETTRGAWTQCVYEVSDAPRYCGTGRWNHRYGVATWTSDRTWRPLPRREYTVRSDYNAINAENRHTIVPGGWTHEQDNTKTVRDGEATTSTVAREFGFNDYRRVQGFDFKPAYDYWQATQAYWARVRNEWQSRIDGGQGIHLKTKVDGTPIIDALFEQAESSKKAAVANSALQAVFEEWTAPASKATASK